MEKIKGHIEKEGVNYFFKPTNSEKINNQIGYIKYGTKVDTNVDVGFVDYYPITDFLLAKLFEENTLCELETKDGSVNTINDKLIIII